MNESHCLYLGGQLQRHLGLGFVIFTLHCKIKYRNINKIGAEVCVALYQFVTRQADKLCPVSFILLLVLLLSSD